ncbi:MAG: oxygen-independent coproporphyrinogen III oxidase [Myxococcales bacterium]|nr:oxygen-independent coproporphyrinogen III oxidase [Myxococcales bacterium]
MDNSTSEVRFDVIRRLDIPGPRYTSYPPATEWELPVDGKTFLQAVQNIGGNGPQPNVSLYVHMPFCPSMCWFCACNVLVTPRTDLADAYLDRLEWEIDAVAPSVPADARVVQLHWGGGSPSYLLPDQMTRLFSMLSKHFRFAEGAEIAIEVDPRITTGEHLATLRSLGFNRLSIGVQDFDDSVQHAINRIQPVDLTKQFLQSVRDYGFGSTNIDLIYGLPKQTVESFSRTVDAVLEIEPDRLAVYSYAHVPWLKPFQKKFDETTIPKGEERFSIFRMALERLLGAGYDAIGMDHFAKPTDELALARKNGTLHRNFMGYSTRAGADLVAFGLSSISFVDGLYAQNEKKLNPYYRTIDQGRLPVSRGYRMTEDDHLRGDIIQRLMCRGRIDKAEVEQRHHIEFDDVFAAELESLKTYEESGLLVLGDDVIECTLLGRILIRPVAMVFDAHLRKTHVEKRRFSKTV